VGAGEGYSCFLPLGLHPACSPLAILAVAAAGQRETFLCPPAGMAASEVRLIGRRPFATNCCRASCQRVSPSLRGPARSGLPLLRWCSSHALLPVSVPACLRACLSPCPACLPVPACLRACLSPCPACLRPCLPGVGSGQAHDPLRNPSEAWRSPREKCKPRGSTSPVPAQRGTGPLLC